MKETLLLPSSFTPDIFERNTDSRALTVLPQQHDWGEPAPSTDEGRNTSGFEAGLFLTASTCGYDGRPQQNMPSWFSFTGKQVINYPGIGLFQTPYVTGAEIPNPSALVEKKERQKTKIKFVLCFQENALKVK